MFFFFYKNLYGGTDISYNECRSNRYPVRWTSSAVQELFQIDSLKSDQVPNRNTTNSSSPPSPNLSSVAIAAIAIGGVLVGGGILCAIATISIRKIRKNHTKPSTIRQELAANEPSTIRQELTANEPSTIRQELAANEPSTIRQELTADEPSTIRQELAANERQESAANEYPTELLASINPAELLDHHKDRTELE